MRPTSWRSFAMGSDIWPSQPKDCLMLFLHRDGPVSFFWQLLPRGYAFMACRWTKVQRRSSRIKLFLQSLTGSKLIA
jgi:hypothetical protein